jgi:hypothetical protein
VKKDGKQTNGVGSYEDVESLLKSDGSFQEMVNQSALDIIGQLEWLKTDLLKKGKHKHAERLERISGHAERISQMIEWFPENLSPSAERIGEEDLQAYSRIDQSIGSSIARLETQMEQLTSEKQAVKESDLEQLESLFSDLIDACKQRNNLAEKVTKG